MKTALLRVQSQPGLFSTERIARFHGRDREHTVIVDGEDVNEDQIRVYVLDVANGQALIHLPRETQDAGNRVYVPVSELTCLEDLRVAAA